MDVVEFNKARWEELSKAGVIFSRPFLSLDPDSARNVVDPQGIMGDVQGKDVLCLASGGGQQSAAFGLLGANVTVFDLSETQLQKDRDAAAHYGLSITTVQGDMQDLSYFDPTRFDLVWQAYAINFVPDAQQVLRQVARAIRPGGLYRIEFANPFVAGLDEGDWNGQGYPLRHPYINGAEIDFDDPEWQVWYDDGSSKRVKGPIEFRHTLGSLVNGLVQQGFVILGAWEEIGDDPNAAPGTWEHLKLIAPPWITFWATYQPQVFSPTGFSQQNGEG